MNNRSRKTRVHAIIAAGLCLLCTGARASTIQQQGATIVIVGEEANAPEAATTFQPSEACVLTLPPVSNAEQARISNFQAQRQKFMDCVARNPGASQQNLDRSLAAVGIDQLEQSDIIQQVSVRPVAR